LIVTLGSWDGTDLLAPTWVVVLRKSDGAVVDKIWAGRAAGAGEAELAAVQADLQSLDVQEFLNRRDPGRSSGRTRWGRRKRGLREFTADAVADEAELRVGQALCGS